MSIMQCSVLDLTTVVPYNANHDFSVLDLTTVVPYNASRDFSVLDLTTVVPYNASHDFKSGIIIVMKSLSDVVNDSEDCSGELLKANSTPVTVSQSTNHGVGNIHHTHYHHSLLYVELNKVNGDIFVTES